MRAELEVYEDCSIIVIKDDAGQCLERYETTDILIKDFHRQPREQADPPGTLPGGILLRN